LDLYDKKRAREPPVLLPFTLILSIALKFVKLGLQLFLSFAVIGIRYTAIYRANRSTLGFVEIANTFGTLVRVNFIPFISGGDCLVRAFRLTGTTIDTILSDFIGHLYLLLFGE